VHPSIDIHALAHHLLKTEEIRPAAEQPHLLLGPVIYFCLGVIVYGSLELLFWKTGVRRSGFRTLWFGSIEAIVLGILCWPVAAFAALVLWLGDYLHLRSARKRELERLEELKNPYSQLKFDTLIDEQSRALKDVQELNRKRQE